jgi:hypothetical protein
MEKIKHEVILCIYTILWGSFLIGATFPQMLSDYDTSFLKGCELSQSIYSLTMIMALHLIDTAYMVLCSENIEKKQLRYGLVCNFLFIAFALIFLVSIFVMSSNLLYFILFWVILLIIKYLSIKLTQQSIITELSKPS